MLYTHQKHVFRLPGPTQSEVIAVCIYFVELKGDTNDILCRRGFAIWLTWWCINDCVCSMPCILKQVLVMNTVHHVHIFYLQFLLATFRCFNYRLENIDYPYSCVENKGALRVTYEQLLSMGPESGIVDEESPSISLSYIDKTGYKCTDTCAYSVSTESMSCQLSLCLVAHYLSSTLPLK